MFLKSKVQNIACAMDKRQCPHVLQVLCTVARWTIALRVRITAWSVRTAQQDGSCWPTERAAPVNEVFFNEITNKTTYVHFSQT